MGASPMVLSEAELHGLVDGQLESDRRADVLRRLAMSPADRALVEAWQEQNELIRAAFGDVEREPLPASLDLVPRPPLRCVPADSAVLLPLVDRNPGRSRRIAAGLATLILIAVGLGGSWILMDATSKDQTVADSDLRGTIDATLADRATVALDLDAHPAQQHGSVLAGALPTTTIPELWPAGFSLTSAETDATAPASLIFHYESGGAERVVVIVARGPSDNVAAPPARVGTAFTWHHRDSAFAIVGTIASERLRAIAVSLQGDDGDE